MSSSTHYATYSTDPKALLRLATDIYEALRGVCPERKILVVYSGFSGASLGSAIMTVAGIMNDENMSGCFIRKPETPAHSRLHCYDREFVEKGMLIAYVDDFICSGASVNRMRDEVRNLLSSFDAPLSNEILMLWLSHSCLEVLQRAVGDLKVWVWKRSEWGEDEIFKTWLS